MGKDDTYRIPDLKPEEVNHSLLGSFRQMKSLGLPLPLTPAGAHYLNPMEASDLLILEVDEKDVTHIALFKKSKVLWVNRQGHWEKLFQKGEIYFWTAKFNEALAKKRGYDWTVE